MSVEDNRALQEEELVGLEAIFADDMRMSTAVDCTCEVHLPSIEAHVKVVVQFQLGPGYPATQPPEISIIAHHLNDSIKDWIRKEMTNLFQPNVPVLYQCIEWLQERRNLYEDDRLQQVQTTEVAVDDEHVVAINDVAKVQQRVVHGEAFVEKRSTFQGHLCEVYSINDVQAMMQYLNSNNKIRNATHNILAYRIANAETGGFIQDFDDDGETAAGGRLLHLLQIAKVENVAVCVSRWFGGVLLGPARFSHINNAARDILLSQGYIQPDEKKKR